MIYFDTDFWINYFIEQNIPKQDLTKNILLDANEKNKIFTSLLNIQEATFVMSKLQFNISDTEKVINELLKYNPIYY